VIIQVPKVSPEGTDYIGEESPSILGLDDAKLVRIEGPIAYELRAEIVSHELIVQGRLAVKAAIECSRCAEFFSTTAEVSSLLRAYDVPEGTEDVDLTADIREDVLLAIPPFPVCSEGCKGLCPQCGRNLNEGACSCKPAAKEGSDNWGELDKLKLN